jgi:ABC-2 type transport system permease protein
MSAAVLTLWTLWQREVVRFLRQRSRVMGALLQPIVFWVLFGYGLGASFQPQGAAGAASYREYYFAGTIALIVLFTAIFSSISVIEDRNEGFLQSVLVAPVPRLAIVLGKVLGCATLAVIHGMAFALLSPLAGIPLHPLSLLLLLGAMGMVALSLSAIGFLLAWRTDSVGGFHAMMSVLLFPMWLLSGAFFPVHEAPWWLRVLAWINPMTYGVATLRYALYRTSDLGAALPGLLPSLGVTLGFAGILLVLAPRLLGPGRS